MAETIAATETERQQKEGKTMITRIVIQGFKSFNKKVSIPFLPGFNIIAGPNGVGKSLHGNTPILLASGDIKPIGEIVEEKLNNSKNIKKLDDGILTFENYDKTKVLGLDLDTMKIIEKDVLAFIKREGEKNLYRIKTWSGREVIATDTHPVMTFKKSKVAPINVAELQRGDLIAVPKEIILQVNQKLNIPFDFKQEEFARFLGYLIGDGYITSSRIEFVNKDEELIKDFTFLAKKMNLKLTLRKEKNLLRLINNSVEFSKILHKTFGIEKIHSGSKIIPKEVLFSAEPVFSNLLAGLFECDGYVDKKEAKFEYATKSENLVKQVQFLLLRSGIISKIKPRMQAATNTKRKTRRKYYYLYIKGIENLRKLSEKIPFVSKEKRERLNYLLTKNTISQRNMEDILPKDVNKTVKKLVTELGIKVKPMRKPLPSLASYVEDRCYPTTDGVKKILPLFRNRLNNLKKIDRNLKLDQRQLIDVLRYLKIKRREASSEIGLNPYMINTFWAGAKVKARPENLKKLYEFVKVRLSEKIQKAEKLINILENLVNSDIFWDKIVRIEKVKGEEWVYDLSIPNCHNFIANGIFVHNSNVLDAIAFVLGRTSAKSLRADKLHELIFHGGTGKQAAEIASVTLYLDNSSKIFPYNEEEISVTRKVNRKGVSIYKISGKTTTREKVVDLLALVRIYADGHNIVLQGDITEVIEMNPEERRSIIDEISGIADYNDKKEKASRDLDAVDAKLKEAEIVITERYDLYKRLEEERNAALRYQQLQKQLLVMKASLAKRKLTNFEENLKTWDEEIKKKEVENEKLQKEIEAVEAELERREKSIQELAGKLAEIGKQIEVEKEISYLRTKIMINKDKIDSNRKEISRLNEMMQRLAALEARGLDVGELPRAVKFVLELKQKGVLGTIRNIIRVPEKYEIAVEIAAGGHLNDVVVDADAMATEMIEYLKREKIGRVTFLPLNKIKPRRIEDKDLLKMKKMNGVLGIVSDTMKFEEKFRPAVDFVFGNTLLVENLEAVRQIGVGRERMVTLDGDLVERSGAMTGGYLIRIQPHLQQKMTRSETEEYGKLKEKLEAEIQTLEKEMNEMENKLKEYAKSAETKQLIDMQKLRIDTESELDNLRAKRKGAYERRLVIQTDLNRLNIQKAKVGAELENVRIEVAQYGEVEFLNQGIKTLEVGITNAVNELAKIGAVNFKAIEQYESFATEFEEYKKRYEKILEEKKAVLEMIEQIELKRKEVFYKALQEVAVKFGKMFNKMTGGQGALSLEDPNNLESGLMIQATPAGKRLLNIDSMSGGEKSLTALAFLFAVQEYRPAPFYILDEIDAALDKENSLKVALLIKDLSKDAQFVVITHNEMTIKQGDRVYGCTMENGESKIIGLELPKE